MACVREQINSAFSDYVINDVQLGAAGQDGGARGKPLKNMTKKDIYAIAKEMEIKGRSTMKKDELVGAVRQKAAAIRRRKAREAKKQA